MDSSEESNSIPPSKILSPTALHFPVNDNGNAAKSPTKLPRRLRQRLLKSKSSTPNAQDIETKHNEAQVRRQQFYELLSFKARSKSFSLAQSSLHQEGSGQQPQTKPLAAEQKRYWRDFMRQERTTASLAKAYTSLGINEKSVKVMPFEQLGPHLNSTATIQTAKALLNQIEIHITIGQAIVDPNKLSMLENIDHLLKHVSTCPDKGVTPGKISKSRVKGVDSGEVLMHFIMLPRYPVRVVLCAYMILGHPGVVFSGKGEYESTLVASAMTFIQEFELLISILLEGPIICSNEKNVSSVQCSSSFRSQLERFDKSWCSYLYCFVMWKVKDAKLLEKDLIRAACELEVKKIEKMINQSSDRDGFNFEPEIKAFQEKEIEIQKLLQANMQHLSGNAGVQRMEHALSEIRSNRIGTKAEKSLTSPDTNFLSQNSAQSSQIAETSSSWEDEIQDIQGVGHLQTAKDCSASSQLDSEIPRRAADIYLSRGSMSVTENEVLVNEIVHGHKSGLIDLLGVSTEKQKNIKALVGNTMEKAFWDAVLGSMKQDEPDYSWVLKLMKEVQDELFEMSPSNWRQEIIGTCDIDILSQILNSGTVDMDYLGGVIQFTLDVLLKLSAQAKENELNIAYKKFLEELNGIAQAGGTNNSLFAVLVIKGLRFVLQQIQSLKQDISKARIRLLEPLIKGPAGLEYLRNAFTARYGAPVSLPLVVQWLAEVIPNSEHEWKDHLDSVSALSSQGLLPTTLRAGGSILKAATVVSVGCYTAECEGEKIDLTIRLGLLKLVTEVDGLKIEKLPETLKLNFSRLRDVQSKLQKFTFVCSSLLVLRQILVSDQVVTSSGEMESIISKSATRLVAFIDRNEDVGVSEIIEVMNCFSNNDGPDKCQLRKEVMVNMLNKSIGAGDGVFAYVSRTVYLAARGIVLGGSGVKGRQLGETLLKRIGVVTLTGKLIDVVEDLIVMANLSASIHRSWYEEALKNPQ